MPEQPAAADTEKPEVALTPDYEGFSEGDLGRLQGILFGDHAKRTHDRIDTLEHALLGAMSDLKAEMSAQIADLAQQLTAERNNRTTALSNLSDRVDTEAKAAAAANKKTERTLSGAADKMAKTIENVTTDQRIELEATRRDITAQIEATETELLERNVDRDQLATLLTNIADELKR